MKTIIAVALLGMAGSASAASHTVDVRVSNGISVFFQTVKLSVDQPASFVGPVSGGKSMIFNATLAPAQAGRVDLMYQLELSGGRGSQAPSIQSQSSLSLRPGVSIVAAQCGSWTVELSLDKPGTLGKKKAASAVWDDSGLGNYRITADISRVSAHQRCWIVVSPDSDANVADRFTHGGRNYGFIFNVIPASAQAGGVNLQYQLEYTPVGMPSLQLQNQEALALGRASKSQGQGYKLSLLVEGGAAARAPAEPAPAALNALAPTPGQAPADANSQTVPLLR